jgi:hypothetical protein
LRGRWLNFGSSDLGFARVRPIVVRVSAARHQPDGGDQNSCRENSNDDDSGAAGQTWGTHRFQFDTRVSRDAFRPMGRTAVKLTQPARADEAPDFSKGRRPAGGTTKNVEHQRILLTLATALRSIHMYHFLLWQLTRSPSAAPRKPSCALAARTGAAAVVVSLQHYAQALTVAAGHRLRDKTLRKLAPAQVQSGQSVPDTVRSASHGEGSFVAKNAHCDIIPRRHNRRSCDRFLRRHLAPTRISAKVMAPIGSRADS